MAKLILSLNESFLGEYPVNKDRITIGRRPANDIHLDNLAISGYHAAIVTIGSDSFLEDLDSTNGTFVNGRAVKRHALQHGDRIEFGKYQLRYVNPAADQEDTEAPPVAGAISSVPEVVEDVPHPDVAVAEKALSPDNPPSLASVSRAKVRVLSGAGAGRELELNKALTTLGKPGVQIAVITRRPQGYYISHVEGQNYPTVNGTSIGAHARQLNDHDVIEMTGVRMGFYLEQGG